MNAKEKKSIKGCKTFEELLDIQYGAKGTPSRDRFDREAEAFIRAERPKEAGQTQAERIFY